MLFGLILKNIKVYKNQNYIPISNSSQFSAFIGENGVGKSTVLEALNSFFNNKEWKVHHEINDKGYSGREPIIAPFFLIKKSKINKQKNVYKDLEILNKRIWKAEKKEFNSAVSSIAESFLMHRDTILNEGLTSEEYFMFPLGLKKNNSSMEYSLSIFDHLKKELSDNQKEIEKKLKEIFQFVLEYYRYIYIPAEINFETYTKIEGQTIQSLMGKGLNEIINDFIHDEQIKEINQKLGSFLHEISSSLDGEYEYKKPSKRQIVFNRSHLTEKIIEAYFETKILNKKINSKDFTPVYDMSSGEKRKALIDIAKAFLLKYEKNDQQIILAIDEPEISLHVSAIFYQFKKIIDISKNDIQSLITTHWYGFMPIVSNGSAIYISEDKETIPLIDLRDFQNELQRLARQTKGKLPIDVELKGINELVQSIIASVLSNGYKWVLCEGISDKIYIQHMLQDIENVFVLPLGIANNVKKVYEYLFLALDDHKGDIKGKIFLMIDTDKKYIPYETKDSIKQLKIRRLLNSGNTTEFVKLTHDDVFPPTEIEDVLNPEVMLSTLKDFAKYELYQEVLEPLLDSISITDSSLPSTIAFDLRGSEMKKLEEFFDMQGVKVKFALQYIENDNEKKELSWIKEIRDFLIGK